MRRLFSALIMAVAFLAAGASCGLPLVGSSTAYASRALAVHNESVMDAQVEVARLGLLGVKVDRAEAPKQVGEELVLTRIGHVDPGVDRIILSIDGLTARQADGQIVVKAFTKDGEELAEQTVAKSVQALVQEKLQLSHSYVWPGDAKKLRVEMSYISSYAGHTCTQRAVYYLELV